jgi:hypothetical protein
VRAWGFLSGIKKLWIYLLIYGLSLSEPRKISPDNLAGSRDPGCDSVTLLVNGRQRRTKTSIDKRFIWSDIIMPVGKNAVEAIGFTGTTTVRDTCSWLIAPAGQ